MRSLFWRVFAWYLGTTVVVLGLGFAATMLTDPDFRAKRAVSVSQEAIQNQARSAAEAWDKGGAKALREDFAKGVRARFLFDSSGHEVLGKRVPPRLENLVSRTFLSHGIEIEIVSQTTYAALKVTESGKSYVFMRILATENSFHLIPHPLPLWVRLLFGLFTASLICVLFAHYVTSPLRRLRSATREFAGGNLEVRIGKAKPFNRKDEFADLAHDFDNMAGRIQDLVITQQRLMGDISHELRSPLARLQLALEIARRKSGPDAEKPLNRIEQEAEKLNTLIGQILRSARTEQLSPGSKRLFDLSNLVREVAGDADFEASGKDRRVLIDSNELSLVHGDRELLRSAIENVVRNAIRYTPDNTDVRIDSRRIDDTHATVTVRDCGPGVPAESLPHLFEPFYRVNDARDRDSGGAGLGLAITRHVIAAHGGAVRATNCDGGFEIQIDLPLKVPEMASRNGIKFRAL